MLLQKFLLVIVLLYSYSTLAQEPKMMMPIGHSGSIKQALFSPDERFVLTGSGDGTAKLWDRITGRLLQTYSAHRSAINSIDFSHDGKYIATGADDSSFAVWETISGKIKYHLGISRAVKKVQFNKDATELMVCSGDTIRIIDLNDGLLKSTIYAAGAYEGWYHNRTDTAVYRLANNRRVGICWPITDSTSECAVLTGHQNYITGIEVLPNKTGFITTSYDSTARIFNLNGDLLKVLKFNFGIKSSSLSADGRKILFVSRGTPYAEIWSITDTIKLASIGKDKKIFEENGIIPSSSNQLTASFSTKGNYIITAVAYTMQIQLYEYTNALKLVRKYNVSRENFDYITFSKNTDEFILGGYNPMLFSAKEEKPIARFTGYAYNKNDIHLALHDSIVIVQSDKSQVEVWDSYHQKLLYTLEHAIPKVGALQLSPSTQQFITVDYRSNDIQLWETRTGKLLTTIKPGIIKAEARQVVPYWAIDEPPMPPQVIDSIIPDIHSYNKIIFHPNGNIIAAYSTDMDGVPVWDLKTGKLIINLMTGINGVLDAKFSPNGSYLAAVGRGGAAVLLHLDSRSIQTLPIPNQYTVNRVEFDLKGNKLATSGYDSTIRTWSTGGKLFKELKPEQGVSNFHFTSKGDKLLVTSGEYLQVYNATTLKREVNFNTRKPHITSISMLPGTNEWLLEFSSQAPMVYNADSVSYYNLSSYGNYSKLLISTKRDRIITMQDSWLNTYKTSGDYVASYFLIDSTDHLSIVKGNYYYSSPNAAKKVHYVTPDLQVISFDQLDVKYNRPDIVLQEIGYSDTALIQSYRRAYEKRIRKLGLDTAQLQNRYSLPTAIIKNKNNIAYEQTGAAIQLSIHASDSSNYLERLNIWVNDVPIWGADGIQLNKRKLKTFDTTVTIRLSTGENTIETSVTNNKGAESYRMPMNMKYSPKQKTTEKLYFIGIGIDEFADASHNLRWSVKDIRDLSRKLKQKYTNIIIDTLFNKTVTRQNILLLKQKLKTLSEDDKVIISYSGHGLLSKQLDYYLSTYNVNFTKPETNGLAYEELESLIDGIKPRRKLVLIDACHSGEVDKEEIARIDASTPTLDSMGISGRSTIKVTQQKKVGMLNSFELMQNLFVNVGRGTGATVISAAGGMQYAQERGDLKNGVFTYSIIEAFNKYPGLTVSQLRRIVGERVVLLTNGLQKPTSRNETNSYDWRVW